MSNFAAAADAIARQVYAQSYSTYRKQGMSHEEAEAAAVEDAGMAYDAAFDEAYDAAA